VLHNSKNAMSHGYAFFCLQQMYLGACASIYPSVGWFLRTASRLELPLCVAVLLLGPSANASRQQASQSSRLQYVFCYVEQYLGARALRIAYPSVGWYLWTTDWLRLRLQCGSSQVLSTERNCIRELAGTELQRKKVREVADTHSYRMKTHTRDRRYWSTEGDGTRARRHALIEGKCTRELAGTG
jgi:hypothetical protein